MQHRFRLVRDLVLIGGGHTHALLLRSWGMNPVAGVRLTLIDPGPTAAYSGMLPGYVAGHYTRAALDIDLVRLARFAGARLILDAATGLNSDAHEIRLKSRAPVVYDIASLDVGITSEMPDLPGFAEHAVPAKPLGPFAARWSAFLDAVRQHQVAPRCVVIGGGVAGCELAVAMAYRLRMLERPESEVHLVESATALSTLGARAQNLLRRHLAEQGVRLHEKVRVTHLTEGQVHFEGRERLDFGFCVGAAGTRPHDWLAGSGLATTGGFVNVTPELQSESDPALFAVGDCAHLSHAPRPKAGVYAVREAPVLHHNLLADLTGGNRRSYRPQKDYLKLISLGRKSALVERGPVTWAHPLLWRWKDRIDRHFMEKLGDLPAMARDPLPPLAATRLRDETAVTKPLCGGCGAKVGPRDLSDALKGLRSSRSDVISAPGDDAAILAIGQVRQVITTDHLRAVVADPTLMTEIAAIHALGDIWAMGAAPQAALSTLILPEMSPTLQQRTLAEITRSATEIFGAAGADVVGGHTTLGAELTIGFTVTGLAATPPLTLAGARPGDALILTKPIGTGTLLAAEMEGRARGVWMAALYAAMVRPMGEAAEILAPHARAMTDVTGFGLAGHILGMARASGVGVTLDPDAIAFYDGAEELAASGLRSSLYGANADHAEPWMTGFGSDPKCVLLHDPQTCGGLLAAVPAAEAQGLLAALAEVGVHGRVIGRVTEGAPHLNRA